MWGELVRKWVVKTFKSFPLICMVSKILYNYGRCGWGGYRTPNGFWQHGCPSVVVSKTKVNDALY